LAGYCSIETLFKTELYPAYAIFDHKNGHLFPECR